MGSNSSELYTPVDTAEYLSRLTDAAEAVARLQAIDPNALTLELKGRMRFASHVLSEFADLVDEIATYNLTAEETALYQQVLVLARKRFGDPNGTLEWFEHPGLWSFEPQGRKVGNDLQDAYNWLTGGAS